jgi:microcystin-dependent protein
VKEKKTMGKRLGLAVALVSLICLLSSSVMAVPGVINYQGKLTNTSDCVLTGNYQIHFFLYCAETGGTPSWDEEQNVYVDQGLLNVQLGKKTPFPPGLFDCDGLYLEMAIPNPDTGIPEILSPRQRLTSTAYAMRADHATMAGDADTVDGKHASDLIATELTVPRGGIIMYSGAWNFDGTGKGTGPLDGWVLCNGNNGTPDLTDRFIMAASTSGELGATGGTNSYTLTTSQMPSHSHTFTTSTNGGHTHVTFMSGPYGNERYYQTSLGSVQYSDVRMYPEGEHSHSGATDETGLGTPVENRPAFLRLAYIMKL